MPVLQDARSLEIAWLYVPRSFTELHFFFFLDLMKLFVRWAAIGVFYVLTLCVRVSLWHLVAFLILIPSECPN